MSANRLPSPRTVLFVHGMGRSPVSAWPMLSELRRAGYRTESFSYSVALEQFDGVAMRLRDRMMRIANRAAQNEGPRYILLAHSLGGVLSRAALARLPEAVMRPDALFLLGSPVRSSRLARMLSNRLAYRTLTGDCGQLLATEHRMSSIGAPSGVKTFGIFGVRGLHGRFSPFGQEPNDSIVSHSEIDADWLDERIEVPVAHAFMPSSRAIARIVLDRTDGAAIDGSQHR